MNDTAVPALVASTSLDHLALLAVGGVDARTFLDSQLTRNVPPPSSDGASSAASLFGYCSPKGRLLASGLLWADGDTVSLVLSRDLVEPIAKRLRMYVLRAKVTITDLTASRVLEGLVGPADVPSGAAALEPWTAWRESDATWVRHPDVDGRPRYLRIAQSGSGEGVDADLWRWLDLRAGLPLITANIQDRFVPQMLNLEALGAVDFRKGCFPGQEVVARSQYLGKLKRRTTLGSLDASASLPAPGTDLWRVGDSEACGLVVGAARGPDRRIALLAELPLSLFAADDLHVGTRDGPTLAIEPLPYPLPDNEVFVRPKL